MPIFLKNIKIELPQEFEKKLLIFANNDRKKNENV